MAYKPEYFQNNKSRFSHYATKYRDQLKLEMIEAYGGKCLDCGETDPIVLVLDHINDDANIEKELYGLNARGGHKHYARLKKEGWPKDRFQLLCANCNLRKEHLRRRAEARSNDHTPEPLTPEIRARNMANVPPHANNSSGFKGVFWSKQRGKWTARVMQNYKQLHLGFFDDIRDAARAYKAKAIELWGEAALVPSEEEIEAIASQVCEPIKTSVSADELDL